MDERTAETVFWIVHLPLMAAFVAGLGLVFSNWLKGSVGGRSGASPGRKMRTLARAVFGMLFSARLGLLVRAFVVEAWFNRRLYRNSRWRWLNHFLLLSGFMLTTALSGISALSVKVLMPLFDVGHVPWIGMWANPDHLVPALLNETGSLLMTLGLVFFIARRYVWRPAQLRTGPMDTWMVVGLGLILLSGWATEIARLNSSDVGTTACFAFVAYPLAPLFRGLPISWDGFAAWMYVIHGLLTSAVIVTIPFSKFMHVVAGAVVTMVRGMEEESAHGSPEKRGAHGPG
jgi:nitrate reductase gamma subunit